MGGETGREEREAPKPGVLEREDEEQRGVRFECSLCIC